MKSHTASISASGDTTLVSAPGAGKFLRVLGYQITTGGAADMQLKSGSTVKTYLNGVGANGGISSPPAKEPYFDCALNEALVFNQSAAVSTGVTCQYAVMGKET